MIFFFYGLIFWISNISDEVKILRKICDKYEHFHYELKEQVSSLENTRKRLKPILEAIDRKELLDFLDDFEKKLFYNSRNN